MRFGLNFGLSSGAGGSENFCITTVSNDGIINKYGYRDRAFGIAEPTVTAAGDLLYEFTWDASGLFTIAWGVTGTDKLTDVESILVSKPGFPTEVAEWNGTNYSFVDLNSATNLITDDVQELCLTLVVIPTLFIEYDFTTLLRGA